jgi:hypothetical protein
VNDHNLHCLAPFKRVWHIAQNLLDNPHIRK